MRCAPHRQRRGTSNQIGAARGEKRSTMTKAIRIFVIATLDEHFCLECVSKLLLYVAPGDEGAAEREKGFVDVRAAFVAQLRGGGSDASRPGCVRQPSRGRRGRCHEDCRAWPPPPRCLARLIARGGRETSRRD